MRMANWAIGAKERDLATSERRRIMLGAVWGEFSNYLLAAGRCVDQLVEPHLPAARLVSFSHDTVVVEQLSIMSHH
jgi:hypothetical protein